MKASITFFFVFFISIQLFGNNIRVSNATLTGQNMGFNTTFVQFDLAWDNSWRDNVNWDAAWVIIKFKRTQDTAWNHATLFWNEHIVPSGFKYEIPNNPNQKGAVIYRDFEGNGNVSLTGVKLMWNYSFDGVSDADIVSVKVFAFEMVYIPQGQYYVGDGTTTNETGQFSAGNTTNPYLFWSENQITLGGTSVSDLGNRNTSGMNFPDDFNNSTTKTLPSSFPKGFTAFYCMKYELSQGQYTEFLNTLTRWQQNSRVQSNISGDIINNFYVMSSTSIIFNRNVIRCPQYGNGTTVPIVFSCSRPDRACNYLTRMDVCAFLDWACLRPMTELEYEKACRGPLYPVVNEYAWGSTFLIEPLVFSGSENGTETLTPDTSNCNFNSNNNFSGGDGSSGPVRCGIFAKLSTTRILSGASYYGVMEMSGNCVEVVVSVGIAACRNFLGTHGDGLLSVNGNGDNSDWPGYSGNEIIGGLLSWKGYSYLAYPEIYLLRISDRSFVNFSTTARTMHGGCRGVLTAPSATMMKNNK